MTQRKNRFKIKPEKTFSIKSELFKRLLFICLGIIPLLIFREPNGPARVIGPVTVIFLLYQFRLVIKGSQYIVDDFFPLKTDREDKINIIDSFIYYFAMTLFLGGLVFAIFEIRIMDNTLNGSALFWRSAFVGIAIATVLTIILKLAKSTVYDKSSRRYSVHFGLFFGFFIFTPAATSFINHYYADKAEECKIYNIVRKSTGPKDDAFWIYLKVLNNSEARFDVRRNFYDRVSEGGQVKLCTKKGKLGYDFVAAFKTAYE